MKPKVLVAICIAAISVALFVLDLRTPPVPGPPRASVAMQAPQATVALSRSANRSPLQEPQRPRIGAPEQPVHPLIRPGALVIEELPGTGVDLRGKTVLQAFDELLAAGEAGDAASTRRAAVMLGLCGRRSKYVEMSKAMLREHEWFDQRAEARYDEVTAECRETIRRHGRIASALMSKAADAGDRKARLSLGSYPPARSEGPEKFAEWRSRADRYLLELADAGDKTAMERLAYQLASSTEGVEALKQALFYFERFRAAATEPVEIKHADRMIASIREEIAHRESL